MPIHAPTDLGLEEYRALRATIRERGTARLAIAAFTFVSWAALAVGVQALVSPPVTALAPLLVLVAGFEIVFALHVGVERIGRYLQVYFEPGEGQPPAWEHATMRPRETPGTRIGADATFAGPFIIAALLNLVLVGPLSRTSNPVPPGAPIEFLVIAVVHSAFILRVFRARRLAAAQRLRDLDRFRTSPAGKT